MSMEAGVLIGINGKILYEHLPIGRSGVSLPDSRDLWEVIWAHRDDLAGFCHSHPGMGLPVPSHTDVTTFAAVEAALGRRIDWWIITEDKQALYRFEGPGRHEYGQCRSISHSFSNQYEWHRWLWRISYCWY